MRLWSVHPKYLDRAGLVALWREALLAQAVLGGKTRGYRNHPQLIRFRCHGEPLAAIALYLKEIFGEAQRRGYRFDAAKIGPCPDVLPPIPVARGQLLYEAHHLRRKLIARNAAGRILAESDELEPHPLFMICEGEVEIWEKVKAPPSPSTNSH
jgi:hypothetical protein